MVTCHEHVSTVMTYCLMCNYYGEITLRIYTCKLTL